MLGGCRSAEAIRDPEYLPLAMTPAVAHASYETVAAAVMPEHPDLAGEHGVDEYVRYALLQNPQIQARRKRVEAAALRVPQAASLKDPEVAVMGYPFFPNVPQTASGRMTVDVVVSQEVPWHGKLRTRAEAAESEADMARAELVAEELEVVEQVKRSYYELYFIQRSLEITEESRALAVDLSRIAEIRYRTAQVSQQDLLRAELEVAEVDAELVRLRQELQSAQARLARLLHVSPETAVRATANLPHEEIPRDLQLLYERAIAARPELHVQLNEVRRERFAADLARLDYYPDLKFSFGWGQMTTHKAMAPTADGIDNLSVGVMANIPVYRKRLDAAVREAEAKAVASAREYEGLRDRTQEEIKDQFAQAGAQQELLELFRANIVPKADQTLRVSITAYETGKVDFLQIIDNWRQLLRYRIAQEKQEAQLRQSLAALERLVGGMLPTAPLPPPAPAPPAGPEPAPPEPPRLPAQDQPLDAIENE